MPRLTLVLALLIPFWSKFLTLKKDDQLANETFPVDFQDLRLCTIFQCNIGEVI